MRLSVRTVVEGVAIAMVILLAFQLAWRGPVPRPLQVSACQDHQPSREPVIGTTIPSPHPLPLLIDGWGEGRPTPHRRTLTPALSQRARGRAGPQLKPCW